MITYLKRFAAALPSKVQRELKRLNYARQIRLGAFRADEPEVAILTELATEGDWVIDIGANVGHYTLAFSKLVGPRGRVIAFEPIPSTFAHLAANVDFIGATNVTLINAAATSTSALLRMDMPKVASTGLDNPYMARINECGAFAVLGLQTGNIELPHKIRLVKIDAEGHELDVIRGMDRLLSTDKPTLIIEGDDTEVERFLAERGYVFESLPGSWNRIFRVPR